MVQDAYFLGMMNKNCTTFKKEVDFISRSSLCAHFEKKTWTHYDINYQQVLFVGLCFSMYRISKRDGKTQQL